MYNLLIKYNDKYIYNISSYFCPSAYIQTYSIIYLQAYVIQMFLLYFCIYINVSFIFALYCSFAGFKRPCRTPSPAKTPLSSLDEQIQQYAEDEHTTKMAQALVEHQKRTAVLDDLRQYAEDEHILKLKHLQTEHELKMDLIQLQQTALESTLE